jgi:uncharacterized protein
MRKLALSLFQGPKEPVAETRASEFRPFPLLSNPHLQTVIGAYWRGPKIDLPTRDQILWLPDGDGLMLYDTVPTGWQPGHKMALLIHGLTGSHRSPQVQRTAQRLVDHGVRTVRMDQRSAGRGISVARRTYHGGRSDDIRAVVEEMHRWSPRSPISLIGFSLGGNLALKMAGEAVANPLSCLDRVVTIGPPIDLLRCSMLLSMPRNRPYEKHFVNNLLAEVRLRHRVFPDLPEPRFPRRVTVRIFDDLYTAPTCGFADALDYYQRASALPVIPKINVPTLIMTARDDPFIAHEPIEALPRNDHVMVQILSHGGHLGFLGWDGKGCVRWAEQRAANWVLRDDLPA